MKTTRTIIAIDRSGSMRGKEKFVMDGFNEHIQQIRDAASKDPDGVYTVSVLTFNHDVYQHSWDIPIKDAVEMKEGDYTADGGTSLYDTLGYIMDAIAEAPYDDQTAYLVLVITDGEESSSRYFVGERCQALAERISSFEKEKNVTTSLIGCGKQVLTKMAQQIGVRLDNSMSMDFSQASTITRGTRHMNHRTQNYYTCRAQGLVATNNLMSDVDGTLGSDESLVGTNPDLDKEVEKKFQEEATKRARPKRPPVVVSDRVVKPLTVVDENIKPLTVDNPGIQVHPGWGQPLPDCMVPPGSISKPVMPSLSYGYAPYQGDIKRVTFTAK